MVSSPIISPPAASRSRNVLRLLEKMEEVNCLNVTYLIANCYYATFLKILNSIIWYMNYRVRIQQDGSEMYGPCV